MTMFDTILGIYFYCISGYDLAKKIRIKVVFNYLYFVGDNVKSYQNSSAKRVRVDSSTDFGGGKLVQYFRIESWHNCSVGISIPMRVGSL